VSLAYDAIARALAGALSRVTSQPVSIDDVRKLDTGAPINGLLPGRIGSPR
jgi:hypothetical protein